MSEPSAWDWFIGELKLELKHLEGYVGTAIHSDTITAKKTAVGACLLMAEQAREMQVKEIEAVIDETNEALRSGKRKGKEFPFGQYVRNLLHARISNYNDILATIRPKPEGSSND